MTSAHRISTGLAVLILGGASFAQQNARPYLTAPRAIPAEELLSPIHTHPADPVGGEYGTWANGPNYKVSFHKGYEFYPVLGPAYPENLPIAWRTVSVTAGGKGLYEEGVQPTHHRADWRYEYRYPGVVEAYDVLAKGVEQTFTIAKRPDHPGDLVVTGRLTTKLVPAAKIEDQHAKIVFRDHEGKDIVTYGEAFAVDANGRKTEALTSFDGTTVTLKVSGAWLAEAAYPVVVDPLSAAVNIANWGGATFGLANFVAIGRDDESTTRNIMTFYNRQVSASDYDAFARLTDNDFSNTALVFNDVTATWSTTRAGVASVGNANRWTLCLQRDFSSPNTNRVRVYVHNFGNTTLNSGTTLFHDPSASEADSNPEIGGTRSFSTGDNALLVYQADISTGTNTLNSEAWGILVDATGTPNFGTRFLLDSAAVGTRYDRELPNVNQESNGGTASWIVVWQEFDRNIMGDDWDVQSSRITSAGVRAGSATLGPGAAPEHKLQPRVAGREGRYMISYVLDDSIAQPGKDIEVHRFDWADTAASPTLRRRNIVTSGGTADYRQGGIAFDTVSDSHWALVWQRGGGTSANLFAARVGYTGGPTESHTVYSSATTGAFSPGITFDDDSQSFLIAYATNENPPAGQPVYGRTLTYPATAVNVLYGVACGPGTISADDPFAGDEFWRIYLTGVPAGQPSFLFLGAGAAAIPLASAGLGLCTFNVNPTVLLVFSAGTGAGSTSLNFPLPDEPIFVGNVWWQWFYGFPTAPWVTKFGGTQGLRTQVR